MVKRLIVAVIAIFLTWSVWDFVIHGLILQSTYAATAALWRPMTEMKMGLMHGVTAVVAVAFAVLYASLVSPKTVASGLRYGLLFGAASGISMGLGTYSVMPIPLSLAVVWCAGTLVGMAIAGLIAGAIIRMPEPAGNGK